MGTERELNDKQFLQEIEELINLVSEARAMIRGLDLGIDGEELTAASVIRLPRNKTH